MIAVALDAAWGTTGWSICTEAGPVAWGHAVPSGTWRYARLARFVDELVVAVEQVQAEHGGTPRLVVERAALKHSGVAGRGHDPTRTVRGLSECIGAVQLAGVRQDWSYPWQLEPKAWRLWWGLHRGGRAGVKASARALAASQVPTGERARFRSDAHAEDVAEAILIGMGAVKHADQAPAGPSRQVGSVIKPWRSR